MKLESNVIDDANQIVLLRISGRIKSGYLEPLIVEFLRLAQTSKSTRLILDVQEVDSIDSSGIGELIKARTEFTGRGGNVVLLGSNSRVEMVIKLSGLDHYFPVAATREEAIELAKRPADIISPDAESEF